MKLFKNIFIVFAFLLIGSGAIASKQCALRLTDATPSGGQYQAYIEVYFQGNWESTTSTYNVFLNTTNYLPFSIVNDVEANDYFILVYVYEPFYGWYPPVQSISFNTYYYLNYDVPMNVQL